MTPDRWRQVTEIFHAARAMPDAAAREAYLGDACQADAALRADVDALLTSDREAALFGERPLDVTPSAVGRLSPGATLGPYRIEGFIGAGGMGEVYRARDTVLKRHVAIKVLPDGLAGDADRLMRFAREAQALASLNHPNIAAIHGLEQSDNIQAIVLELVDGPTLAERLRRGPLPLDDALRIAGQLVDALEAAHAAGIVHRDLKPSNVKVRRDGTVKVLDFGLAKVVERAVDSSDDATTMRVEGTHQGAVLGTPAYMSPEQASGRSADRRADIWAFGCVLYEMLAGRRAFEGRDVSTTLSAVLTADPDWAALQADTPPSVRRLLRRSLVRRREDRLADIADARFEIAEARADRPDEVQTGSAGRTSRAERTAWIAVAAMLAALALSGWLMRGSPPSTRELLLDIAAPATTDPTSLALSPDGRKLLFAGTTEGRTVLWIRPLDSEQAELLVGTENARLPFWSPDGRSIGFGADATLKRLDLADGTIRRLALAPTFLGGTWGTGGDILFVPDVQKPVFRIPEAGGTPVPVTAIRPHQNSHHSPVFLPDGRRFLFFVRGGPEQNGVHVGQLGSTETRRLFDADAGAELVPPGYLIFTRGGAAVAQPVDPDSLASTGEPVVLAQDVALSVFASATTAAVSVSTTGTAAYRTGSTAVPPGRFVWTDRSGREVREVGPETPGLLNPALSLDERRVAVFNGGDIWMLSTDDGAFYPITSDPKVDFAAVWSPDGSRLAITSNRLGVYDLFEKAASGAGAEDLLLATDQPKAATDWSPDGNFLLYRSFDPVRAFDIWALDVHTLKPFPLVQTDADERDARFSPDGRWIAYQSNESGRFEIWVQPFSSPDKPPTGRRQVSLTGGAHPRWSRPDGRELFYVASDGRLMSVPVRVTPDHAAIEPGVPQVLFPIPGIDLARQGGGLAPYMVGRDSQRFLIYSTPGRTVTSPIRIRFNWLRKP